METLKAKRSWTDVLQIIKTTDSNPDYYTQQNFHSPYTEKTRNFMAKPELEKYLSET